MEELLEFKEDFMAAERIKKFHKILEVVNEFLNNNRSSKYNVIREVGTDVMVFFCDELGQLAISICTKVLSEDRIESIWKRIFPMHDFQRWIDDSALSHVRYHLIYGFNHDHPKEQLYSNLSHHKVFYSEEDVQKLLAELSLAELANIVPKIQYVKYRHITLHDASD